MAFDHWLITGGCGFIGTNLLGSLVKNGTAGTVRILDNLSTGKAENIESALAEFADFRKERLGDRITYNPKQSSYASVELVVGDIRDRECVEKAVEGMEITVHLAASTGISTSLEDPLLDMESNITGTLNLLETSRKARVKRFVFASSCAAVGETEPPIRENVVARPISPYGAGKLAGEAYCHAYFHSFHMPAVALRFSNVYGPGSDHKSSVVAKFIRQAMQGEPLVIYGDGNQTRDFIYIDDLVRAIRLAATADGIGGEVFQIATNAETTISELVEKLVPILADIGIQDVAVSNSGERAGEIRRSFSDTAKARELLAWQAEVGLDDGLEQTVAWFAKRAKREGSGLIA